MSSTPREIGTLIAVVLKARNLPNKRHIGKQDPYCVVVMNGDKRRTRAIKRGGQHPEWDEEVRFTLYEDVEDELARSANGLDTPPPPPPKDNRREKKIKGGKTMTVMCYADDQKEPDLIGEGVVDLTEVLTKGETDEWFTIMNKDKYCGEVYLELTFWSNEKAPEKKSAKTSVKPNKQYGGPGSFVPSADAGGNHTNGDSVPPSLRPSSSLAQLDLYVPPYEQNSQRREGSIDQITDEFGALGLHGPRRRGSFPPTHAGHISRPVSDGSFSSTHSLSSHYSQGYNQGDYPDPTLPYSYDRPETPTGHPSYHHASFSAPRPSYSESQSYYQPPYEHVHTTSTDLNGSRGKLPSLPSSFAPGPTPQPSGFLPVPSSTPTPSGFVLHSTQQISHPVYAPHLSHTPSPSPFPPISHTPAPSGFLPPFTTSSSMGFHPPQNNQHPSQSYQYPSYPHPPASAPPQSYPAPGPPSSAPPLPHSAPPYHYHSSGQPPPASPTAQSTGSHQYSSYPPSTPSPPHPHIPPQQQYNPSPPVYNTGSRPLPYPGQHHHQSNGSVTPGSSIQVPSANATYSSPVSYNPLPILPPPPPPPPNLSSQAYQTNGYVSHAPPPPPPPLAHNPLPLPPPPPPPSQYFNSFADSPQGRPNLPQPPGDYSLPPGHQLPPPPPPFPQHAQHHTLPQPPQALYANNGQSYHPGPPPRPPAHFREDPQFV